jgi:hypothetical protein
MVSADRNIASGNAGERCEVEKKETASREEKETRLGWRKVKG